MPENTPHPGQPFPFETLLIGLGAQKAGTTWLWQYLSNHPECAPSPLKEIHFFTGGEERLPRQLREVEQEMDAHHPPEMAQWLASKRDFITRAIEFRGTGDRTAKSFAALMATLAAPGKKVAAELTPANINMAPRFLKPLVSLPMKPKFIMILRDPVGRTWSQIRMVAKARAAGGGDEALALAADDILERFLRREDGVMPRRHNYAQMIGRATEAIPPDRRHIVFFETFMQQSGVDAFCDFIGVSRREAKLDEPVFVGRSLPLSLENRRRLRDRLAEQYSATEAALGQLPDEWIASLNA